HVDAVKDLTDGAGADVVLDFVAEQGAEQDGFAMTRRAGSYSVIGYGGEVHIPTLDIISTERNIIGNIVGTYNELAELMVLAEAVKSTLGPKGRNGILEKITGSPVVTNDGVTIAREIHLRNQFENMGAQLVKEAAIKTNDIVGDGTTTATVLAQAIVREGMKA